MDETTTNCNCCLWDKVFRRDERSRYLEACKELLQYVIENKLLKLELVLNSSCFIELYHKKETASSNNSLQHENKSNMDVNIQK